MMISSIPSSHEEEIDYIIHLADIHIRLFSRHEEYIKVFTKLYRQLQQYKEEGKRAVIVICGDIFHSKLDKSAESEILCHSFFHQLASFYPTFCIAGNHDALLSNSSRIDGISSILYKRTPSDFFYLKDTGVYQFQNVCFYVNSLLDQDQIDMTKEGEKTSVNNKSNINIIKVALFHGAIKGWKNQSGFQCMTGDAYLEEFSGMDYLLLGDIHMMQYMSKQNPVAAYASSLISQNFGETDTEHGFLLWDLRTKTQEFVTIENEHRHQLVEILDKETILTDNNIYRLESTIYNVIAPRGKIKVVSSHDHENESREVYNYLRSKFTDASFSFDSMSMSNTKDHSVGPQQHQQNQQHQLQNNNIKNKNSDFDLIDTYLRNHVTENDYPAILKIVVDIFQKHLYENCVTKYELIQLTFSNLFGYGEKENKVELVDDVEGGIFGVFGENTSGKSSLIDILVLMLFDKITRFSHGNTIPKEVIRFGQKEGYGRLKIKVGSQYFFIEKVFKRQSNGKINTSTKLYSYDNQQDTKIELTDEERRKTNSILEKTFGKYEAFLFFHAYLQQRDSSFREMTSLKRKTFLQDIFGFAFLETYEKIYKEKQKVKEIEKKLILEKQTDSKQVIEESLVELNRDYEDKKQNIKRKKEHGIETVEKKINNLNRILKSTTMEDISKQSLDDLEKRYEEVRMKITSLQQEICMWKEIEFEEKYQNKFFSFANWKEYSHLTRQQFFDHLTKMEYFNTYEMEELHEQLKVCYGKYNQELSPNSVNRDIMKRYEIEKQESIQIQYEQMKLEEPNRKQNLKKLYSGLVYQINDPIPSKNTQKLKNDMVSSEKEKKRKKKKIVELQNHIQKFSWYEEFQDKKNTMTLQEYIFNMKKFSCHPLYKRYSPLVVQKKQQSWNSFQLKEKEDFLLFEEKKSTLHLLENQLDLLKKEREEVNYQSKDKIISQETYTLLKKKEKKMNLFFNVDEDKEVQTNLQFIQNSILKYKEMIEHLHFLEETYNDSCRKTKINPKCAICVKNPLYLKKKELEEKMNRQKLGVVDVEKTIREKLELVKRKVKQKLGESSRTWKPDELNLQKEVTNFQIFFEDQSEMHGRRNMIEAFERKRKYEEINTKIDFYNKEKETIEHSIQKIYAYISNKEVFEFINYQYSSYTTGYSFSLTIENLEKISSLDITDYEDSIRSLKETEKELEMLMEKDNDRKKDLLLWEDIIENEAAIETMEIDGRWLDEVRKFQEIEENEKIGKEIKRVEDLLKEKEKAEVNLPYLYFMKDIYDRFQNINMLGNLHDIFESLRGKNERLKREEKELILLSKSITDMKQDVEVVEKITSLKQEKQLYQNQVLEEEQEIFALQQKINALNIKLAIFNKNNEKLQHLTQEISFLKQITDVLQKDGLPSSLLKKKISNVEKRINTILIDFIPDKKIRFQMTDKSVDFGFISYHDKDYGGDTISNFMSGMEAFLLDLTLKICLGKDANQPIMNLFFIDEKISSLDKRRLINIDSLFAFLKQVCTNVFLISHLDSLKDYVDEEIYIHKDIDHGSTICFCK